MLETGNLVTDCLWDYNCWRHVAICIIICTDVRIFISTSSCWNVPKEIRKSSLPNNPHQYHGGNSENELKLSHRAPTMAGYGMSLSHKSSTSFAFLSLPYCIKSHFYCSMIIYVTKLALQIPTPYNRQGSKPTLITRFMGPTWGRQDPGGPHVGPMNFVI